MADTTIGGLQDGGTVQPTDMIPVERGDGNRRVVVGTAAAMNAADFATAAQGAKADAALPAATAALVATTGNFDDLSSKPELGTAAALNAGAANGVATLDSNGQVPAAQIPLDAVRPVTAAGAVNVLATDRFIVINKAVAAATAVNLPSSPSISQKHTIKDGKHDAFTNNITVTPAAGTIDGQATYVIASNSAAATFIYNGTEWNVI